MLEDDAQRLYQHEGFDLPDAVTIGCSDNFRSPRTVCEVINALALVHPPIRSLNPYQGEIPGIRTYGSDAELLAGTEAAVASLLSRGFALADIAIVSGRGRDRSALLNRVGIGPYLTRRFTGEYDRNGEPRWSSGDLLVESIYRYKGQSAPAVVVAEFDFAELDDAARRRMFVALTRPGRRWQSRWCCQAPPKAASRPRSRMRPAHSRPRTAARIEMDEYSER